MKKQQTTLFCAGFGYVASFLADKFADQDVRIIATTRSSDTARALDAKGIEPIILNEGEVLPRLPGGAHWLIAAPPSDKGCPIFKAFSDQADKASWIGYLSTTGVYGDLDGGWAFEWSKVNPQSARANNRVVAENQWLSLERPAQIFRLPGIYGPGRSAFDRLAEGNAQRILKKGQVFSRAHASDIADCLKASMARPNPGRVYHPCDDEPAPPQDVIAYAAMLIDTPIPPEIPIENAKLSPMAQSFYAECKRISNARTKSELDWQPSHANYRDGLRSILEDPRSF